MANRNQPMTDREYVDAGGQLCPFCGSTDISAGEIEVQGRSAWQQVDCGACEREWTDEFTLTGFEGVPK